MSIFYEPNIIPSLIYDFQFMPNSFPESVHGRATGREGGTLSLAGGVEYCYVALFGMTGGYKEESFPGIR